MHFSLQSKQEENTYKILDFLNKNTLKTYHVEQLLQ